jgi:hypothetical protein
MGGRMSGESPRVEKFVVANCRTDAVRQYQTLPKDDIVTAIAAGQAS